MFFHVQQFRDAALEVLTCGLHIPHAPTAVSINMRSFNRRSRLTSFSRNVNLHSKVLPLWPSPAKNMVVSVYRCLIKDAELHMYRPMSLREVFSSVRTVRSETDGWFWGGGQNRRKTSWNTVMQSNTPEKKKLFWYFIELHYIARCSCSYCIWFYFCDLFRSINCFLFHTDVCRCVLYACGELAKKKGDPAFLTRIYKYYNEVKYSRTAEKESLWGSDLWRLNFCS